MAPIPPFVWQLVRILAPMASQAITRRLLASPLFYQLVSRTLHEFDHLPKRLNGQKVPPWIGTNPQDGSIADQAKDAWGKQFGNAEDVGEPHDLPSPFPPSKRPSSTSETSQAASASDSASSNRRDVGSRTRSQTRQQSESTAQEDGRAEPERKDPQAEWRELQEKLQEMRRGGKI